jgi:hypothetical protein
MVFQFIMTVVSGTKFRRTGLANILIELYNTLELLVITHHVVSILTFKDDANS